MCFCSKQSSLFSFYALPSGGKSKGAVVHCHNNFYLVANERDVIFDNVMHD